ncbi:MAG: response regulator [Planctomycetes bacterium]|nr:response regulator [Planctomycetota bacterium]
MRPGDPDPMSVRQAEKSWWDEESLALLTHELRNGLGPIASALYILRLDGCTGELADQACDIIERQTEHLTRLVDRLSRFAGPFKVPARNGAVQQAPAKDRLAETRPHRILVVDDNRDAADSTGTLLLLWGHEVRVAYDGAKAVALAREYRPDLCLVDIGMPGMNGRQVAELLRRESGLKGTLLVAMTGFDREGDRTLCREAGFDDFLVKPVDMAALREILTHGARQPEHSASFA